MTPHFADLPAEQFIEDWLVRKLNVKFLSIGDDFKFGAKRLGNFAMLQQAGKQFGFEVEDSRSFCLDVSYVLVALLFVKRWLKMIYSTHIKILLGKPLSYFRSLIHGNKLGPNHLVFYRECSLAYSQVNPVTKKGLCGEGAVKNQARFLTVSPIWGNPNH